MDLEVILGLALYVLIWLTLIMGMIALLVGLFAIMIEIVSTI